MKLAVIIPFLNEARFLPRLLASIDRQTRLPDRLILVDDGSSDGSLELASAFAATHPYAVALSRPPRGPEADRLGRAAELRSFEWALGGLGEPWDVVAKLDADLELNPRHIERLLQEMAADPGLGVTGAYLTDVDEDGTAARFPVPRWHVRGATKFYRRECYEEIRPIPAHLGWDTIDEIKARRAGWRTESFELPGGDTLHLRPTGRHDGRLRASRRWGECAWGYGAHPGFVLLSAIRRITRPPYGVGGAMYALGYAAAAVRRRPRVDRDLRAFVHREEARLVLGLLTGRGSVAPARPVSETG
jgi:poly-beta-1,6-N-acetyl-D-glucosamine synthase